VHTTLNTSEGIALDRLVRCSNATYISDRKQVEIGQAYVSTTHMWQARLAVWPSAGSIEAYTRDACRNRSSLYLLWCREIE